MVIGRLAANEIIASHPGTDFDALASMVAAQKLHPGALPVTQGRMDSNVKEFLSLYGDLFKFARAKDVDLDAVTHLITVDINRPQRLGTLAELAAREGLAITVYDHHPPEETQAAFGPNAAIINRPYGSGTSALVELLRERAIPISPVEATLFAIGISEDTGSLSFGSVTAHDFLVMGYLHECGVQQEVVNRFLSIELDQTQKALLQKLSLNVQRIRIKGIEIAFTTARTREMVPEVAVLTRKIQDVENVDVMFALVESGGKTVIVGRSRTPAVDCNAILGHLGGGGHPGAAAATVKEENLTRLTQDLVQLVRQEAVAQVIARDIMSAPVRTIGPEVTIQEGYEQVLLKSGHSGLVVVDENERLVGIMSRKDFDKALRHNLGHAPVKGYMTREVIFIQEDTSLEEMADYIINHGVGRLPVVFGGKVVGIITRSDVLRALHTVVIADELPHQARHQPQREKALEGLRNLPEQLRTLVTQAATIGDELQYPVYLVGGIVRDFLLGRPNTDIDLLVEGDAHQVARRLADKLQLQVEYHERFGTATLHVPPTWQVAANKVDVATARTEWYERPGALPEVDRGDAFDDSQRRDFTINAMALRINGDSDEQGELVDHMRGLEDLERGVIRVLHPLSFVEDPTRIFRALRFATRFGFAIEPETDALLRRAVTEGRLEAVSGQRLREELLLLCGEPAPGRAFEAARVYGIWEALLPGWEPWSAPAMAEGALRAHLDEWSLWPDSEGVTPKQLALLCLFANCTRAQIETLCARFVFFGETPGLLLAAPERGAALRDQLADPSLRPSAVHQLLERLPPPVLIFLDLAWKDDAHLRRLLQAEALHHRQVTLAIGGKDLTDRGFQPGPHIGEVLRRLLAERIDGRLEAPEAQWESALQWLAEKGLAPKV